jgi:hypothetical protein
MSQPIDRKAAITAWKDRDPDAGFYAFRGPDGQVWVGATQTLSSAENRIRFTLRTGSNRTPGLQAAWNASSGEGFSYEVLARLDADLVPMARQSALKEDVKLWRARLGANPI